MGRFGLSDYARTPSLPPYGRHALLATDGPWTLLADDWFYTLWYMPSTRPTLAALAETCDVFACSVGECDESFDFLSYRDGTLVRHYVVASPDYRSRVIEKDFGDPLPGESAAFAHADAQDIVLEIATSQGVKTTFTEKDIRIYAPAK